MMMIVSLIADDINGSSHPISFPFLSRFPFHSHNYTSFTKDTHQYFTKPSPVDVGDYIEFLAEIDLLVSASTCPQGDVSVACGDGDVEPVVFPLKVEVYELKDKEYLKSKGWKPSPINGYSGNHGL
mmetsp:Transcript_57246/g.139579  ORF Transcript_57246/g.139579 Transcript_57246/m.139579 type:complete len:126 (-) Transcript_57246:238-615(-)